MSATDGVVTATFADDHLLGNGFDITISGAGTGYDGTFVCLVTSATTITYSSADDTLTGTSSGTCEYNLADVEVKSENFGDDTNKAAGDTISLTTPITDIDTDGKVQQSGFSGGSDAETDESLRDRGLYKKQNPSTNMNVNTIVDFVLALGIADRCIIAPITPDVGQFTVYCMKDDFSPLSAAELTEIKDALIADDGVVFLVNPTQVTVNFEITGLDPDTAAMQTAITNSITDMLSGVNVGEDITLVMINRAILNSATDTAVIVDYTLTAPASDVTIGVGEIAILGTVTYV